MDKFIFYLITIWCGIAGYSLNDRIDLSVSRVYDAHGESGTNNESADFKTGAGLEWNVESLLGYNLLPLGMKVGYAHGFDEGGEDRFLFPAGPVIFII